MLKGLKYLSSVQVPFVRMALWGFIAFVVSVGALTELGTRWHNNYEYYGKYPALYLGPALVAFLIPAIFEWWRKRRQTTKNKM